ncbi:hypothetical protein GCM10010252_43580 [Streptomyces aureoverticillatus]|nr:hypothetical protein GCM10010252_43580 [Streptomyces aureoverticillatus]
MRRTSPPAGAVFGGSATARGASAAESDAMADNDVAPAVATAPPTNIRRLKLRLSMANSPLRYGN